MLRRNFSKKKISGFIKSYHAKVRQRERVVTDRLLKKIFEEGDLEQRESGDHVFKYDGYEIYVCPNLELILTVVSPPKIPKAPKALSKEDGERLKSLIKDHEKDSEVKVHQEIQEEGEMSFDDYMKKHFPKEF